MSEEFSPPPPALARETRQEEELTELHNVCGALEREQMRLRQHLTAAEAQLKTAEALWPKCHVCGKPARCFGAYEDPRGRPEFACDNCCGHGNEDGWCKPVAALWTEYREIRDDLGKALDREAAVEAQCAALQHQLDEIDHADFDLTQEFTAICIQHAADAKELLHAEREARQALQTALRQLITNWRDYANKPVNPQHYERVQHWEHGAREASTVHADELDAALHASEGATK